ncbi:hypothetical protein BOX15_Mlig012161g2, partial [Macrostomum lignano]
FFSIIVFACISAGGYVEDTCIMNGDHGACGFGIFVGAMAFVACIVFLILDAVFAQFSSAEHRKYTVMSDIVFSAIWSFFYFVAFCYMTNKLSNTPQVFIDLKLIQPWQVSNVRASIAFSFFSIGTFAALAYFAVQKYRQGVQGAFDTTDQIESQVGGGGSGGPHLGTDYPGFGSDTAGQGGGYQKSSGYGGGETGDLSSGGGQYQQPAY